MKFQISDPSIGYCKWSVLCTGAAMKGSFQISDPSIGYCKPVGSAITAEIDVYLAYPASGLKLRGCRSRSGSG